MTDEIDGRLNTIESRLRTVLAAVTILVLGLVAVTVQSCRTTNVVPEQPHVITVSELDVVDPHGVIRARIGGDLPDAVINGKKVPRGGQKIAGLLIYDDTGQERGGYVTYSPSQNAALSLDPHGSGGETVLLVAAPDGTSAMTLTHGNDLTEMRVDPDIGPSIHVTHANQVAFHVPAVIGFEKTEMCGELRGALTKASRDQVLSWCRSRVSEEACRACVGAQP